MQDENLRGWQKGLFGKKVQHSILGRVKSLLKPRAWVVLGRFEPTSKLCTNCGTMHKLTLADRMFVCECGVVEDRDVHAAQTMIVLGDRLVGREPTDVKLAEIS